MALSNVVLEFKFPDIPSTDDKLLVQTWISSSDYESYTFFYEVYKVLKEIDDKFLLTPKYVLQSGDQYATDDHIAEHCVSGNKYCAPNYYSWSQNFTGKITILEDLYQYCLYRKNKNEFYSYFDLYEDFCLYEEN